MPGRPASEDRVAESAATVSAHEGWLGLPTAQYRLPANAEIADVYLPDPVLAVARAGRAKRWYTVGSRKREFYTAPRVIELLSAGYEADRAGWAGVPGEGVAVKFPAAIVNRLLHSEGLPFNLATRHEVTDDRVTDLVYALADEALSGSPRGALYVEGLTLALIGLLSTEHGARRLSAVSCMTRFSVHERSKLREFVTANMAENLRIDRLAAAVSMSPDHFSRVFKATFGQSPHAYVVEQRLEVACRALRLDPERSIADIASGAGFSSQSHFTEVFRRRIGTTPARWRSDG